MFEIIATWVSGLGHIGVAVLMFVENLFTPIPSELVMPLAGYLSAEGQLWLPAVIFAGTICSVLGALLWYYIGAWIGEDRLHRFSERHGAWLTISPKEVDSAGGVVPKLWLVRGVLRSHDPGCTDADIRPGGDGGHADGVVPDFHDPRKSGMDRLSGRCGVLATVPL